jgi:hypothetical protein
MVWNGSSKKIRRVSLAATMWGSSPRILLRGAEEIEEKAGTGSEFVSTRGKGEREIGKRKKVR